MRRWRLNSGYNGTTDQRRTKAGTIPMLKHNMERNLGAFEFLTSAVYETVTYNITGGATVTNNGTNTVTIFRTSGGGWDSQAYSSTSFTAPCTIEFNKQAPVTDVGNGYAMIGWNEDPTTNASYTSLDYAAFPYQTSAYEVLNNASNVHTGGAWSTANKFYLVYGVDGTIKHYNGSTLLFTANYGAGKTVYVDTSILSINATNGGFTNVKVTKNAWNGTAYTS
jgi:hypothetical protein